MNAVAGEVQGALITALFCVRVFRAPNSEKVILTISCSAGDAHDKWQMPEKGEVTAVRSPQDLGSPCSCSPGNTDAKSSIIREDARQRAGHQSLRERTGISAFHNLPG